MIAMILLTEDTCKLAFCIFHFMSLIDDNVFPVIFIESESIFEHEIVGGDANIPFGVFHLLQNLISCCRVASIYNFSDTWSPFVEL